MNAPYHLNANVDAMVWSDRYLQACLSVTTGLETKVKIRRRIDDRGDTTTISWLPDQRDLDVASQRDKGTLSITVPNEALPFPAKERPDEASDMVIAIAREAMRTETATTRQREMAISAIHSLADHILILMRQRHPEIEPLTLHLLAPTPGSPATLSIGEVHPSVPDELIAAYGIDPVWLFDGVGDALHSLTLRPVGFYANADRPHDRVSIMRAVHAPGMERLLDTFAALLPSIASRHRLSA